MSEEDQNSSRFVRQFNLKLSLAVTLQKLSTQQTHSVSTKSMALGAFQLVQPIKYISVASDTQLRDYSLENNQLFRRP